jgi:endonuclease-3
MIGTALDYHDPWELLVATVLSAQTTDENVNRVTAVLFTRYPTAADLAAASVEDVEEIVYSTGFFHQKSAAVIALSQQLCERFDGVVPNELDQLVTLPGVGRKTASVVLAEAFGQPAIAVDTHVSRVSRRLGLTDQTDPAKIEADLMRLVPVEEWPHLSMRMIQFGRDVCDARRPLCGECELNPLCPWPGKTA